MRYPVFARLCWMVLLVGLAPSSFAQSLRPPAAPVEDEQASGFVPVVRVAQPREIPMLPETTIEPPAAPAPATAPVMNTSTQSSVFGLFETPNDVGRGQSLLGETGSASQGRIGQAQLRTRPLLRTGELFETVPGLIVTQHSGSGKANQWFLRGFNLDHGTDFTVKYDDIPLNLPSHAHGQGYLDVNFIIPELIDHIDYKKGPYYAELGDFASAGGAELHTVDRLSQSINKGGLGTYNYYRALLANSQDWGYGHVLYAFENEEYQGPWVVPENFNKYNGLVKYTLGDDDFKITLTGQAYYAGWTATDQIPLRAVNDSSISRYGSENPTDGGNTSRFIGNAQLLRNWDNGSVTKANFYSQYYQLNLYSDFTYFLVDPVNGDQIAQRDRRGIYGTNISHQIPHELLGRRSSTTFGTQIRYDDIPNVELDHTVDRQLLSVTRQDYVQQTSGGIYMSNTTWWRDDVRTVLGQRGDFYNFNVNDMTPATAGANSGLVAAGIWSPKASIIFGPWEKTEYFLNWGYGFHSNDARGTTTTVDPNTLQPVNPVTPLVRSQGYEVGMRTSRIPRLNTTLAVWYLHLDSELLFTGDAGTTEATYPTQRYGVEWSNYYLVSKLTTFDFDFAATHAEFLGNPDGSYVPGAVNMVINSGPTFRTERGFYSSWRVRYFGPRPLIESGDVFSSSTTVVNAQFGYRNQRFQCGFDILNMLGTTNHDIDYYYTSRLQGEPLAGVNDIHFHPVEAVGFRAFASYGW